MFRRVNVQPRERAIASRRGQVRYLRPGAHWLFGFGWQVRVASVEAVALDGPTPLDLWLLTREPSTWDDLAFAEPRRGERALVWIDGRIVAVVSHFVRAFWRVLRDVRVEHVFEDAVLGPPVA